MNRRNFRRKNSRIGRRCSPRRLTLRTRATLSSEVLVATMFMDIEVRMQYNVAISIDASESDFEVSYIIA